MPIEENLTPADSNYPCSSPYESELSAALEAFQLELSSSENYEDEGEREGVELLKKTDPLNPYGVPYVKGSCLIENVTKEQFLATIQLPGMRRRWDSRFEEGIMRTRFSRDSYSFYSCMKGMSWLVWPRDLAGIQKNFYSDEEIIVIQTSVVDDEVAPDFATESRTRATLTVSGWQLLQQGNDLKVTYVVKIALNGSIPFALVNMIATETPLCVGRARDVFNSLGHAPYVSKESSTLVTFQKESFSDPPPSPGMEDALEYNCGFTTNSTAQFEINYSTKMYSGGINATVAEGIEAGVEVVDDGVGTVTVTCTGEGKENVVLVICPK